ncbi:MAG: biotin--[acetyl-CoA-carboxylase] ligase [Chitinophagia bacterium]|nr:biotin--[acetyl-CoA-carboxylase] ligase [Chitinophagia bacterium]
MIGKPFIILSSVDSTNNHAMQLIRDGKATSGTAIFALEQTNGKGQRGRIWESVKGENIMLTVIMDAEQFSPMDQFPVSAAVILGCHDFFSAYAGEETSIKWPNDLYWRDRKAGGILIENIIGKGKWKWSVIGIGININQVTFDAYHHKAVSLKQITGKHFDSIALAQELCSHLENRFKEMEKNSTPNIVFEFNKRLFKKGQVVKFRRNQIVFDATVLQSNMQGELEIQHSITETIRHGEIEWLL